MQSAERQLLQSFQQRLTEVQGMMDNLALNDAVLALHQIVARKDHPSLDEVRQRAKQMLQEATAQRDRHAEQSAIHVGRAKVLLEDGRYQEAIQELVHIPASLRDETATKLLARAESIWQEIARLKEQIQQPDGIAFRDRMTLIERLLDLVPSDPQARRWAQQVHDFVLTAGRKKFQQHRYQEALELLHSLPDSVQNEKSQQLLRQAAELAYLESELLLAPTVTSATIEAAQRLLKIDPNHEAARQASQEMISRHRAVTAESGWERLAWTACPQQTHVGVPVHYCPEPQRLSFATPEYRNRFHHHPGQFHVACGLALQAIQRAAVTTNLLPNAKQGVLGKLRASLLERPARVGWGLDLSNTSLKAVQLTVDDGEQIRITQCLHIAHGKNLSHLDDTTARASKLRETLAAFSSRHSVDVTERVAIQWPAVQSLARLFSIPPADGRKLKDLIQLEARRQVPFPLEDVSWDSYLFPTQNSQASRPPHQVLLLAVRQRDIEERLELFREHGIEVHVVQCDAVALHNFLQFGRLARQEGTSQAVDGIAALDIGSDATNIVFSFPDMVWFRATRLAGDELITNLSRRFKITNDMAEQVLRNPIKVKRMSALYEESCAMYRKMVGQFEMATADFQRDVSQRPCRELLVSGGVGQAHGLLRYLRFGR